MEQFEKNLLEKINTRLMQSTGSRITDTYLHKIRENVYNLNLNDENLLLEITDPDLEEPIIQVTLGDRILTTDLLGEGCGMLDITGLVEKEVRYIRSILRKKYLEQLGVTIRKEFMTNNFHNGRTAKSSDYEYNIVPIGHCQISLVDFEDSSIGLLEINFEHYCGCHINFDSNTRYYSIAQELKFLNPGYSGGRMVTTKFKNTAVAEFIADCYKFPIKITNLSENQQKQLSLQANNFRTWGITIIEDKHPYDSSKNVYILDNTHTYDISENTREERLKGVWDVTKQMIVNITGKVVASYITSLM